MIYSMTGYASCERNTSNGVLRLELRSVNQRYLELQLKLDDTCRAYETQVRDTLKAKLGRGKVECRLNYIEAAVDGPSSNLNHAVLQQIAESTKTALDYFPEAQPINMLDLLRMPGVIAHNVLDDGALDQDLKMALDQVLQDLISARGREGSKLKVMILARLTEVEALMIKVKPMLPTMVKAYQEKLLAKLHEAQLSQDDERIRQEIVLYTQRIDVDEELSRLDAHVDEVKHILAKGGLVGKQLDFLMQEMNREANTLGSKSVAIETTQISMQLKVLIEQMREQIQNIE